MSEPQMTKEQLDEIERLIVSGNPSDALALAPEPVLKIIALAREGLRLREPPIDGDYLRQLHREFDCGCETCARTAAVCPATASSLFQEVAVLREHRDRLTAELDSLRNDLRKKANDAAKDLASDSAHIPLIQTVIEQHFFGRRKEKSV